MPDSFRGVAGRVEAAAERWPDRPALVVEGATVTYRDLWSRAGRLAAAVHRHAADRTFVAVVAARDETAYVGVLGALAAGCGYVPLNPAFPVARSAGMLRRSGARTLVAGPGSRALVEELLAASEAPLVVLLPEGPGGDGPLDDLGRHQVVGPEELAALDALGSAEAVAPQDPAYLLFTSGSTGEPKGVTVSQANVGAYLDHIAAAYGPTETDRCSQMFDLTFDLSVHDLFVTWSAGASLHVVPATSLMAPGRFIVDHELTHWFSVPSVAALMGRMRMLKAGLFPSLRVSLFCGEAFPVATARQWAEAAPNSVVDNLYGPTEATIAIAAHRVTADEPDGVVSIGTVFPTQHGRVADPSGAEVPDGEAGELLVAGTQITGGYLGDPERTAASFVTLADSELRPWYRTGDLVRRVDGELSYLGRVDEQIQVLGHRVELQEIDSTLRRAAGTDQAMAVSWPPGAAAEAVYAFVAASVPADEAAILDACRLALPAYMVPRKLFVLPDLPVNANGKTDRKALAATLKERLDG